MLEVGPRTVDTRAVNDALELALSPPTPGVMLRSLAPVFNGARRTKEQIVDFHALWRERSVASIEAGCPIIVALGDSLSQGIGASEWDQSWLHRLVRHQADLSRGKPLDIVNFSRSGARLKDVMEVQLPALRALEQTPTLITCTVGNNDLVRSMAIGSTERDLMSLIARLPKGTLFATLPANGSLLAKRLNRIIRNEAPAEGLVVADVDEQLFTWRGRSAGDRFHPNDLGYEAWFNAFAAAARLPEPIKKPVRKANNER